MSKLFSLLRKDIVTELITQNIVNTGALEGYLLTLDEGKPTLEYYYYQKNWCWDLDSVVGVGHNDVGNKGLINAHYPVLLLTGLSLLLEYSL